MRINKYLALAGIGSRRKCDEYIQQKRILINDQIALVGSIVFPEDRVYFDGQCLNLEEKIYFIFNKPLQVLTTLSDPFNRATIMNYIQKIPYRVFPVGRLDYDSQGLLLLTNDGDFAHRIQHPKYHIKKIYYVRVSRNLMPDEQDQFQSGVDLEEGKTALCSLQLKSQAFYEVILYQGWKRQIRRMFAVFHVEVFDLQRVQIGSLKLNQLKIGEFKKLDRIDVKTLKKELF